MAYKTIDEINPSLKSIKPPISLEQANAIAAQADAIGADKGGWGAAISAFKKANTVRKGKWTKREEAKSKESASENGYMPVDTEPTYGATSFGDLDKMRQADETTEKLGELITDLTSMMTNICYSMETDKQGAMQRLLDEFMVRASEVIDNPMPEEAAVEMAESFDAEVSEIDDMVIAEADTNTALFMDVKIIRPGWGNTRDNNFYPAEMLKRDANKFVGAKMYETDHKDSEKSTRTWVSTIKEIKGFAEDGAPIARVAVHDPNFSERVKNLKSAGILEKMECSIYGAAKGKSGYEQGGRSGKLIESISGISSVDWVTVAGAGGHAVALAENAGGEIMPEEKIIEASAVVEAAKSPEKPVMLSESEVRQALSESKLPEITQKRIEGRTFATIDELQAAITSEKDYIAKLAESGKVFGMSEAKTSAVHPASIGKDEAMKKLYSKYPL